MKKLLVLLMALVMTVSCLAACTDDGTDTSSNSTESSEAASGEESSVASENESSTASEESTEASEDESTETSGQDSSIHDKSEGVMTWAEYNAAELDSEVVIEAFVQGKQSWWDNKCTVYAQDKDGAYFMYEMTCSEEDYERLTVGTKIKVTGFKSEWAGEVEIVDCTFEILSGSWVAEPTDVTDLLGKDELINHQNKVVSFKGLTVVSIAYQNETQGEDIYVTLCKNGQNFDFCVEKYLTGKDTDLYKAVEALKAGDIVDIEGFLYWYEGVNTHITKVTVNGNAFTKSEGVMTWAEYDAAELDAEVVIEAFVQGKQSWWDNKCTVYAQDNDGAYFMYEMTCSEEDYALLTVGTKIKVTGFKSEWAGEVEIVDCTFEILEGNWVAQPTDVTDLLGKDELINHQNKVVSFKGMTVVSFAYQNETQGEDIYLTLSKDGQNYDFCVEKYLTGKDTDLYKAVEALKAGDVVDIEGFLYWYEGVNTHITKVTVAE